MSSRKTRRSEEDGLIDRKGKISCNRCISKKRKCDGDFFTNRPCTICKKRDLLCDFNYRRSPHYVQLLEEKILRFESLETIGETSHNPRPTLIFNLTSEPYGQVKSIDKGQFLKSLDKEVDQYFLNYLNSIHERYPFLSERHLLRLHKNRRELFNAKTAATNPSISTLINSSDGGEIDNDSYSAVDKFILLLVYAIGTKTSHSIFYHYALLIPNDDFFFQDIELGKIHCLLLFVIHQAQFNDARIWKLISLTSIQCLHLNYQKRNLHLLMNDPLSYFQVNITFWCTFTLERILSNIYDKPYVINIEEIEVCLPLDMEESNDGELIKDEFLKRYLEQNGSKTSSPLQTISSSIKTTLTPRTRLSTAILHLKLRIIESKINSNIYKSVNSLKNISSKNVKSEHDLSVVNSIYTELQEWKEELPTYLNSEEMEYWIYMYDKQIRFLFQPFLTKMSGTDEHFQMCITSCISILNYSKKLHGKNSGRITLISLQTVFLSGLNLIYSILSKKCPWNSRISEGLRNCTAFLVLLSEKFKSCENFSSIFDTLLDEAISSPILRNDESSGHEENLLDELEILKKFPIQFFGGNSLDFKVPSVPSVDLMFGQGTKKDKENEKSKERESEALEMANEKREGEQNEKSEYLTDLDSLFRMDEFIQNFPDLDSFTFDLGLH